LVGCLFPVDRGITLILLHSHAPPALLAASLLAFLLVVFYLTWDHT